MYDFSEAGRCTRAAPPAARGELPAALSRVVAAIESWDAFTPARARRLLAETDIPASELLPWSDWQHPDADSYGRLLVYDGGHFELMVMSWVPGDMAAIHDHGHTEWGAVKLFGEAEHATFAVRDGVLSTLERRRFPAGSVIGVGHDLIHQMGNIDQPPFLSLHLYGSPDARGPITGDARVFDLDAGVVQYTDGGVFFALPEEFITRREAGVAADFPTTLRARIELLRRLVRMNGSERQGRLQTARERALVSELLDPERWASGLAQYGGQSAALDRSLAEEIAAAERTRDELIAAGLIERVGARGLEAEAQPVA